MNPQQQLRSNQQKHNLYSNSLPQQFGYSPIHHQDLHHQNIFPRNKHQNQFRESQNDRQNRIRGNSRYGGSIQDIGMVESNSVYKPQNNLNAYSSTKHSIGSQRQYHSPQEPFYNQFNEKSYRITSNIPQIDDNYFRYKTPEYLNYPRYCQTYESDLKYLSTNNYSQYHNDPYHPNYFSSNEYKNFPKIRIQPNIFTDQIPQQYSINQGRKAYQREDLSFEYINQSQMHEIQNFTSFSHQKDSSVKHDEVYCDKSNDSKQKLVKSSVQLLIDNLNDINSRLSSYVSHNQKKDHTQSTNLTENIEWQLQEEVEWMSQLLGQNYKLYENSQNEVHFASKYSIKNYMKHYNSQNSRKSLEYTSLIDYQDQLQTLFKLDSILDLKHISSEDINSQGMFSSNENINNFIRVVLEIGRFYYLSYQILQQKDKFNMSVFTSKDTEKIHQIPLLIKNILWQLQVIRILIKIYDKELNTFKIQQEMTDESNSNILQNRLNLIKSQCIQSLESLEQLAMQFLQQVMVHPQQSSDGHMSPNQETQEQSIWYFYYDQLQFNNQWILLLLDTLLQYEMIIGRVSSVKYLNSQYLKKYQQLHSQKCQTTNINKVQEKLSQQNCLSHNPKGKKNMKKGKEQKQHIESNMFEDMINNFMSILSFLLYPQNKKEGNSFNSIVKLIEKPIKDMIVKCMNVFFKYIPDDSSSQDQNRETFNKHIVIHKITSIAALLKAFTFNKVINHQFFIKNQQPNLYPSSISDKNLDIFN